MITTTIGVAVGLNFSTIKKVTEVITSLQDGDFLKDDDVLGDN